MLWTFENAIFQFFANFWIAKLKLFSGKARQSIQKYLNQNLVLGSILGNGFEVTSSSTANALNFSKWHFLVFCKFLSNKVGKVRQSMKNCVNQNMVIGIFLENGFKASLSSKTNVLSVYKMIFFKFFAIFQWESWNHFLGKWGKASKTV